MTKLHVSRTHNHAQTLCGRETYGLAIWARPINAKQVRRPTVRTAVCGSCLRLLELELGANKGESNNVR